MNPLLKSLAPLLILVVLGCKPPPPPQPAREAQAASLLKTLVAMYYNEFPHGRITNVVQLFEGETNVVGYPYNLERLFHPYGNYAGFTNSFYEKYVVVPPGVKHSLVPGEILMLSSQPFPDREGQMQRYVFWKDPSAQINIDSTFYSEHQVQEIFREARVEIPKPPLFPKPPPGPPTHPEHITVELLFQRLAQNLGFPRHYWFNVMLGSVAFAAVIIFPVVWFWVRRTQR